MNPTLSFSAGEASSHSQLALQDDSTSLLFRDSLLDYRHITRKPLDGWVGSTSLFGN
jgi:hypothetical protein